MMQQLMISSNTRQYQFENASWIRLVEFLAQENSYMKNRLSEILDHINDRENLELAEGFQNQFIIKDDLYDHLLYELKDEAKMIKDVKTSDRDVISPELKKTHKNFRDQIDLIERDHGHLKKDYNTFLYALTLN